MFEQLARWLTVRRDDRLGARGERAAAGHLRRRGYRIIARNWVCKAGEIDLIVADGDELVFVEVKTRTDDEIRPEQQVHAVKQAKLRRLAMLYLKSHPWPGPARFDVVAVVLREGKPLIRHHVRAFTA